MSLHVLLQQVIFMTNKNFFRKIFEWVIIRDGNRIASHLKSHRIPRFFRKNIASNYRIKTTKKIASVIALQNLTKKICDFFDYFDFFVFNSISFFCLVIS